MPEMRLKLDPSDMEAGASRGKAALDDVKDSAHKTEAAVKDMADKGGKSVGRMAKSFSALKVAAKTATAVTATAITAMLAKGARAANQLDAALGETSTLITGTAEEMDFLRRRAEEMASTFGGTSTEQVNAFYQAISAGAPTVQDAAVMLESANRLAVGGVTDVKTAVDILSSAMNAYSATGLTAAQASDILFTGVKAGKTTVQELASSLGNVIPISSSLGVGLDQVVSAIAALTAQGQSTSIAVTGIRGALTGILRPSSEATKLAKALGIEFSGAALKAKGLGAFLADIVEKTGGSQEAMAKLFGSVEALNAVLAFSGAAGEKYAETMDMMANSAGVADEAFQKMAAQSSVRLSVALSKIGVAAEKAGAVLMQVIVPVIEFVATHIKTAEMAVTGFGVALAALGGALGIALAPVTGILIALGGAVALVASAIGSAQDREGLTNATYSAANGTRELNKVLGIFEKTKAPAAGKAAIETANKHYEQAKSAREAAAAEIANIKAIMASNEAARKAPPGPSGQSAYSSRVAAEAIKRRTDALRRLKDAEDALAIARKEREDTARKVMSADYGAPPQAATKITITPEEQKLKDRVQKILDALNANKDKAGGAKKSVDSIKSAYDSLLSSLDPVAAASIRYAKAQKVVADALKAGKISQDEANKALALAKKAYDKAISSADKFKQTLSEIADSISTDIGSGFMDMVSGTKTVAEAFRSMATDIVRELYRVIVVQRIVANVKRLIEGFTGISFGVPSAPSFAGGGYTGNAPRTGGIDGQGGFLAVMHPRETVIDHTGRTGATAAPTIVINQTFTGGVTREDLNDAVPRIVAASKSAVIDAMRRHQGGF